MRHYGVLDLSTGVVTALVHLAAQSITHTRPGSIRWAGELTQGTVVQTEQKLLNHTQTFRPILKLPILALP